MSYTIHTHLGWIQIEVNYAQEYVVAKEQREKQRAAEAERLRIELEEAQRSVELEAQHVAEQLRVEADMQKEADAIAAREEMEKLHKELEEAKTGTHSSLDFPLLLIIKQVAFFWFR